MKIKSHYALIQTEDLADTAGWYRTVFGFETSYEDSSVAYLKHPDGFELAFIESGHDTIPLWFQGAVDCVVLTFEVEDVNAVHSDVLNSNHRIVRALETLPQGQIHFTIQDPNNDGIVIDIVQMIEPSAEFAANYKEAQK